MNLQNIFSLKKLLNKNLSVLVTDSLSVTAQANSSTKLIGEMFLKRSWNESLKPQQLQPNQ